MNTPDIASRSIEASALPLWAHGEAASPVRPHPRSAPDPASGAATRLTEFGYFELVDKPSEAELADYYAKKYYQQSIRTHRPSYSPEERQYRSNKIEQKLNALTAFRETPLPPRPSFLDIGAGEGFAMDFFQRQGWDVIGVDYSAHGCQSHHPHLLGALIVGEIERSIEDLSAAGRTFDAILLDNVLEHVPDPARLVARIAPLLSPDAILMIEVPNDFSVFQTYLLEKGKIDHPFWVVTPDHISYFDRQGLINLMASEGYSNVKILGDFPIDLFLFNENTNYVSKKDVGKSCHSARIEIENLLHALPSDRTQRFYEAMAEIGIGRQLIGFFRLNPRPATDTGRTDEHDL